jgi:hypothetical protein
MNYLRLLQKGQERSDVPEEAARAGPNRDSPTEDAGRTVARKTPAATQGPSAYSAANELDVEEK